MVCESGTVWSRVSADPVMDRGVRDFKLSLCYLFLILYYGSGPDSQGMIDQRSYRSRDEVFKLGPELFKRGETRGVRKRESGRNPASSAKYKMVPAEELMVYGDFISQA